jgi:hypothetical protein
MKKVSWSKVPAFMGAAALAITLVAGLGGIGPAKAVVIGIEDSTTGFVGSLAFAGSPTILVASDGEVRPFDPFGFGADTSDGIQFPRPWTLISGGLGWKEIPNPNSTTDAWVLPGNLSGIGCGVENNTTCEPFATWFIPTTNQWTATGDFYILSSDGNVSDVITLSNIFGSDGRFIGKQLTFQSVPGPVVGAGLPGLVAGFGGFLGWWRVRRRKAG